MRCRAQSMSDRNARDVEPAMLRERVGPDVKLMSCPVVVGVVLVTCCDLLKVIGKAEIDVS